ncbi:MAG: TraB/GumN family protein [Candidatus Binatia bacterium]
MRKSHAHHSLLPALLGVALLAASIDLCAQEKSFLWKVESGKGTVYLLGSIHMLKREDMALKPVIDEAFNQAKRLVFEIDLLNESPEKMQKLILQKGLNLDGKLLQHKVSRETFQWATIWANELGIDIKMLTPLKPWLAGLTLTMLHLQKMGYDPSVGVDRQLARRAQLSNKPVSGLESIESQFDLFDRLPAGLQEMMLRYSIGEIEQINKLVDRLVRVWRDGEVAAAEQLFLGSLREYPEIQEKLLDERNRNWLPQIEKFLQLGEDTLVVVGAAHLVGKNGVIELLKGRGYKVEQM